VILSWTVTGPFTDPTVRPDAGALTSAAKGLATAAIADAKARATAEANKVKAEAEAKARAAVDAQKTKIQNQAGDAIKNRLKGFGL